MANTLQDIRKTGPQNWRRLQEQNELAPEEKDFANAYSSIGMSSPYDLNVGVPQAESSSLNNYGNEDDTGYRDYWGRSRFDKDIATAEEFQHLGDIRAENQSGIAKLGAGLLKMGTTAGTTFLDGTLGLIYGIGDALYNGITNENESGLESFSRLWDNALSDGIQKVNEKMEHIAPNYRTEEELNRKWYQNLGTINFWADSFLKNMGFTIGAAYSGGAFNKALKGLGLLKSGLGASVMGATYSGINEARIEANNNSDDWEKLQLQQAKDAYDARIDSLAPGDMYNRRLAEEGYQNELDSIKDRKAKMGLIDFLGNTVLLTANDFLTFGKMYSRGFDTAQKAAGASLGKRVITTVENGVKKYGFNPETKAGGIVRGARTSLREGFEELNQSSIAEAAGLDQTYDSPDAYYESMIDPDAEHRTNGFFNSAVKGFVNTYGNIDKWEEFAVGALTGFLGMPTFGKAMNSNAVLGKNSAVGLSGGFFGEIQESKNRNKEGQEAVDYMNKYMQDYGNARLHFAQNDHFTNAMDGWAEASYNQDGSVKSQAGFQYRGNAENADFSAISAFARVGKLDDFKELIDNDYDSISDEELETLAKSTTRADGFSPWKNTDGSYMSDTDEGRQKMREELKKKQQTLKDEVKLYEEAIESVRGQGYQGLDSDKENELAWLRWKLGKFDSRFKSLKKEIEDNGTFKPLLDGVRDWKENLEASREGFESDLETETDEEKKKDIRDNLAKNAEIRADVEFLDKFLTSLQTSPYIKSISKEFGGELLKLLDDKEYLKQFADASYLDSAKFEETIEKIKDLSRIASAYDQFNERLEKFRKNPVSEMDKVRKKLKDRGDRQKNASKTVNEREEARTKAAEDLKQKSDDELQNIMDNLDKDDELYQSVKDEQDIREYQASVYDELEKLKETAGDQAVEDAKTLVEQSWLNSHNLEEFEDLESEIYNNPDFLDGDSTRNSVALQLIKSVQDSLELSSDEAKAMSAGLADDEGQTSGTQTQAQVQPQGKDTQAPVKPVNAPVKPEVKVPETQKVLDNPQGSAIAVFNWLSGHNPEALSRMTEKKSAMYTDIRNVLKDVYALYNQGYDASEIYKAVSGSQSFADVLNVFPEFSDYMKGYIDNMFMVETPAPQAQDSENPSQSDEQYPAANDTTEAQIAESSKDDNSKEAAGEKKDTYSYWRPVTTLYPIYPVKGDYTTEYTPLSTYGLYRRVTEVQKYLKEHDAYLNRESDKIFPGMKVYFKTVKELNDKVGETVILMYDEHNRLIGDVHSVLDQSIAKYPYLKEFVERFESEYRASGQGNFTSKTVTTVKDIWVGRIPFDYDSEGKPVMHPINDVFGNNPFKFGITFKENRIRMSAKKGEEYTEEEMLTRVPKDFKPGKPVLVFKSGIGGKSVAVPFITPSFDYESMKDTVLGKQVRELVESFVKLKKKSDIGEASKFLSSLIGFPLNSKGYSSLFVLKYEPKVKVVDNAFDDAPVESSDRIRVTYNDENGNPKVIFDGAVDDPSFVDTVISSMNGMPINISRIYMNGTFRGVDYNRMIGEISSVNLVPGINHTVGNAFTVNIPSDSRTAAAAKKDAENISAEVQRKDSQVDAETLVAATGVFDNPLHGKIYREIWDKLSNENRTFLAQKSKAKIEIFMTKLHDIYKNGNFTKDPSSILRTSSSPKNRIADQAQYKPWNKESEIKWMSRALPQLSSSERLRIVDGLIKVSEKSDAVYAWGQFKNGIIYISNNAADGTLYHEAFHSVISTLLGDNERTDLFSAARTKYGELSDMELEEKLAENFRQYVQHEEVPFFGKALKLLRQLKHVIQNLFGKEAYIDNLFYSINSGKFADRNAGFYKSEVDDIERYHESKLDYAKLDAEQLEYLNERHVDKDIYDNMIPQQKEILFRCMR